MNNTNIISSHVLISGKVQGVGYRQWTVQQARKLGLKGWVRNLSDGRVEAVFEGDKNTVEQMIKFCHNGPNSARVIEVIVETKKTDFLAGFEVRFSD